MGIMFQLLERDFVYLPASDVCEETTTMGSKGQKADELAQDVFRFTDGSMTEVTPTSMRERLEWVQAERLAQGDYISRVQAFVRRHAPLFDRRPRFKVRSDESAATIPIFRLLRLL